VREAERRFLILLLIWLKGCGAGREFQEVACVAPRGGILAMRPLLLHASSQAIRPRHRRVIHLAWNRTYYVLDYLDAGNRKRVIGDFLMREQAEFVERSIREILELK
jgi:hypothetical protein